MAALKFLFLFFMIGVTFANKVNLEEMVASRKACQKTYPILDKEIDDIHKNICYPDADRLLKMYVYCFMEREKLMDVHGKFNLERLYDLMMLKHKHELKEDPMDTLKQCSKNRKETINYERAWGALKCFAAKKLW